MNTLNRVTIFFGLFIISACGGGGGGGGSDSDSGMGYGSGSSNTAPIITNSSFNISVVENQTSAFTITATDANGDSLTYSIGGTDASLFQVSSSGVVTFIIAPDFENPSDADANNVYLLTASVSDGSASDTESFTVTVTNDTSDDITTQGFDGTVLAMGPVQSATVCIEVNSGTCNGSQFNTTSAQDGTFSLTVDAGTTGVIRSEGGFDPVTNVQFEDSDSLALSQPVSDQNFLVTPLSTMLNEYNSTDYGTLKTKLGIDSNFMIRFDNPFSNLTSTAYNKAAVVYTQTVIMYDLLKALNPNPTSNSNTYGSINNFTLISFRYDKFC